MLLLLACVPPDERTPTEEASSETTLRFAFDLVAADVEIELAPYDPSSASPVGEVVYTFTGAAAAEGLALDAPAAALRLVVDPEQAPEMRVATFVPGLREQGELVGVGQAWPTWVEGTIAGAYAEIGIVAGWNAVFIDAEHVMHAEDPLAIPIKADLRTVESLVVSGGVGANASAWIAALQEETVLAETPVSAAWTLTVSGVPDGAVTLPIANGTGVLAKLVAFDDRDGSGGYNTGDLTTHGICADGIPAMLGWFDPALDLATALERQRRGQQNGWNIFAGTDFGVVSAGGLVADSDCAPS
ncbi:MAG: hypothetical protein Q8P18_28710 [Pseudomonadota bacterium]|nr:hypothetical protein [Pseudomonadota bacterium]